MVPVAGYLEREVHTITLQNIIIETITRFVSLMSPIDEYGSVTKGSMLFVRKCDQQRNDIREQTEI